ncbi:RES family NAD+ phosphorylase [Sphingomonas sp. UYP23]
MIHPAHQRSPFSGEGARLYGGRWNMKGWPALYLATDPATAVAEYYQGLPKPGMLAPYRLTATAVADLTNGKGGAIDAQVAAAMTDEWKTIALLDGQVPPSWGIAQALIAHGAQGAVVPSAQNRGGTNLVLWRWNGAGQMDDGAMLTLLDPDRTLSTT